MISQYNDSEYNYGNGQFSGCWFKHPGKKNKAKREQCEADFKSGKQSSQETDRILAQAVEKISSQDQSKGQLTPMQITGIIVVSLIAITGMVVVIKKVKSKK